MHDIFLGGVGTIISLVGTIPCMCTAALSLTLGRQADDWLHSIERITDIEDSCANDRLIPQTIVLKSVN